MALFIGVFLPDRQLDESAFCKALTKIAIDLSRFRQHPLQQARPNLDLYFMMPGKDESPEFQGMRLHSFDADSNTLRIETSVPRRMIQSMHAEDYVVAALQDAVDGAQEFFESQKLPFLRDDYMSLIDTLGANGPASFH